MRCVLSLLTFQCGWPRDELENPVRVMLLADTHLLGPFQGHWMDKLRREWQMNRAFQTAITLFLPQLVFILGDVFDEGKWVGEKAFREYLQRYFQIFHTPPDVRLYSIVGNHDIGFHYAAHPYLVNRFYHSFNTSGVQLINERDVHFVLINSIAMEGDGCAFCEEAERQLAYVSYQLKCSKGVGKCDRIPKIGEYSRPVLLQHYPLHRLSDIPCKDGDIPKIENYRERWEVLSKESTDLIGQLLNPRIAFSGHTHFYCHLPKSRIGAEEFTVPSFSWRNKNAPSFMLAHFTKEQYTVSKCDIPKESTVFVLYGLGLFFCLFHPLFRISSILQVLHKLAIRRPRIEQVNKKT